MLESLRHKLGARVDGASLAAFRIAFGLMIVVGVARYVGYGWVDELYIQPQFHFTYWGFDWVAPWPGVGMYIHYGLMGVLGLLIAAGLFYRVSITSFFLLFTYTELIDKTAYLNHYYFISIAALLMIFMPLGRTYGLDGWRRGITDRSAPLWTIWTLRLQIGCVYFFAGIAKLTPDWLLRGEPLGIWLASKTDFWLVGPLFDQPWVAHTMSIMGCLFDLTIFFFLLWPTSRFVAYLVVVGFHGATGLLFNIGLFPVIMICLTPIFFEPDWPQRLRHWLRHRRRPLLPDLVRIGRQTGSPRPGKPLSSLLLFALTIWFAIQLAMPLRHLAYPGDVHWGQQGWRLSWRVMLIEKSGHLKYEIRQADSDRRWLVYPSEFLTPRQLQLAAGSPDMILQLAHHLADHYDAAGRGRVEVYAQAYASLNGRPSQPIVDPDVDLASKPRGPSSYDWIVPLRDE